MSRLESPAWKQLSDLAEETRQVNISELMADTSRLDRYSATACGLHVDFSKHLITDEVFSALLDLALQSGVIDRAKQMAGGAVVNVTENRAALHMSLRRPSSDLAEQLVTQIDSEREKLRQVSDSIRSGQWTGAGGSAITDVINIGIGGSDLGPKMVCAALREYANGPKCHFISNVDGAELLSLLETLKAASTLIIISSKTFTTTETLLNAKTALAWLEQELKLGNPHTSRHCIGVTAAFENAVEFGIPAEQILTFPDSIGGRYSLWSAIGLPICIATGFDKFSELLAGAASMDEHFLECPPEKNTPLILGLIGIWYNNFIGARSQAVIPYCQRLRLFVDHLQQLDMESNGKSATLSGDPVGIDTGPEIWGQTGTNGQHAFFQLLHQGTHLIPVDFIGIVNDRLSNEAHHRVLMANMIAQSEALMIGRTSDDLHRHLPGNRPSSTILLDELSPFTLGALLAMYENKVFTQAAIWDTNPFDQWGVELGKQLADNILEATGEHDPSTLSLMKRTGLLD